MSYWNDSHSVLVKWQTTDHNKDQMGGKQRHRFIKLSLGSPRVKFDSKEWLCERFVLLMCSKFDYKRFKCITEHHFLSSKLCKQVWCSAGICVLDGANTAVWRLPVHFFYLCIFRILDSCLFTTVKTIHFSPPYTYMRQPSLLIFFT